MLHHMLLGTQMVFHFSLMISVGEWRERFDAIGISYFAWGAKELLRLSQLYDSE